MLSVDVSKGGLLATGGSDNEVRLWRVNVGAQSGEAVSFVQDLSGHAKPVNAVRWDPSGGTLASAGDVAAAFAPLTPKGLPPRRSSASDVRLPPADMYPERSAKLRRARAGGFPVKAETPGSTMRAG
mgnify:CR=1 FL=1